MSLSRLLEKPLSRKQVDTKVALVVEEILKLCKPSKIVLFGSGAAGTAKPSSDLDFAIIFVNQAEVREAKQVYKISALLGIPIDFLLFDEAGYKEKLDRGGVCELIEAEGRVVFPIVEPG